MSLCLRAFPATGVVAIFTEEAGGGDILSISAPRNAPAASPDTHLDKVKFSSSLDAMEVYSETVVTVAHAAGGTASGGSYVDNSGTVVFNAASSTIVLVTHGLGYIPDVLVSYNGNTLWPGMPVQTAADGRGRYVIIYVTNTQVILYEWLSATGSTLAAISLDYDVIVFRAPRNASGDKLVDFDPATGILKLGFDRFSSDRRYLQVVAGGSPFGVFAGKTGDLNNGAPRTIRPDGTVFNPVPSGMAAKLDGNQASYGGSMAYGGSFSASAVFQVQAP